MVNSTTSLLTTARTKLEEYLLKKGLRRSLERFAILEEVYSRDDHFDAEDLYQAMHQRSFAVSRATVYNTLDVLVDCGLVRKNQFGDEDNTKSRFEKGLGRQQHAHLICVNCHRVIEFCDPRLQLIKTTVGDTMQFQVESHSLVFYGECADEECVARTKAATASASSNSMA
ncbi:Fur family ferric uptake transcriptional regulator [Larkinella arboricola]|uniref:Ferric uptake regulation protein n=1 Tax=Larkinella arboricola TaxID=643671 RepID=A0A327WWJ3_LARAB|nr:transcriptional repressor [Larkinella arboricola]RAJ97692.1 Fur family ferric uptake transcriptional regulator [Larkinella arboricola]